jgi:hypothetical protein
MHPETRNAAGSATCEFPESLPEKRCRPYFLIFSFPWTFFISTGQDTRGTADNDSYADIIKLTVAQQLGNYLKVAFELIKNPNDPPSVAGGPKYKTEMPHTEKSGGKEPRPENIYVEWVIYADLPVDI